jgi:polyhydroxybutyrate depolymerase
MKILTLLAFAFFLVTSLSSQTTTYTMMHDGVERSYKLHSPLNVPVMDPAPLVINMHGYGSNMNEQQFYANMDPIADTTGFLIVYPNGLNTQWNAWYTPSFYDVDDVGFINALIDTLASTHNIDLNRVYCTGMSNGGFMSYVMACESADRIAAIASVTGTMVTEAIPACTPARPIPVLQMHGTADATVPYNGIAAGSNTQGFLPIEDVISFWTSHNGCTDDPSFLPLADINTADNCTVSLKKFTQCDNNAEVHFYKIDGGGHTWPGALLNLTVTNQDILASVEIWNFFKQFTLQGMVSSTPSVHVPLLTPKVDWDGQYAHIISEGEDFFTATIYNLQGKKMAESPVTNNTFLTNQFDKGIYILHLKTVDGKIARIKLTNL